MRDKIINLHSSVANSKDILKKALINNTSNPDQNILQGEIAVINTTGNEGIYTLNSDGTDIIEFKPLSKEEKEQITALISAGVKDEVYVGNDEPSGEQELWIDLDADPSITTSLVVEAPTDGKIYGRNGQDKTWVDVSNALTAASSDEIYIGTEAPTGDEVVWIDTDENPTYSDIAVTEAPKDGKQYARQDGAWSEVNDGILVEDGGTGAVTKELQPNTFYKFGECSSLTITLAAEKPGILNEYMFEFACSPSIATTFNNIPGVVWQNGEPLVPEAGYKYQVSIVNNMGVYGKFPLPLPLPSLTYTTTGASQSVQLINNQEYAKKITLEDGTDVPITGTGALNYTFADIGEHKVTIELKEDVTDFSGCFSGCTSLTGSIPENLFASNTAVTTFDYCFYDCSGLTSIPANLFASNTAVTNFSWCFCGCRRLTSIPENLFAKNTAVTDFSYCFWGCRSLTSISETLFANNTAVTDFGHCFVDCSGLTSIPESLFASNTKVDSFSSCFSSCEGLTNISENLFASNIAVTDFNECFQHCSGLTSIPANLFASNTAVISFDSCFSSCSGLTSIPDNLFASNTAVDSFGSCFSSCKGLTSIPDNLFANNTAVTDFSSCFRYCDGLTSIPANLFASNTAVTTFRYCFEGCSGLTSIPANLFASNTAVDSFGSCFSSCEGLTSIPDNLFANNTAVTSFSYCFDSCSGLTSIPEKLFASNTAVTYFSRCFENCTGLTGNVPIDNDGTPIYNRSSAKSGYAMVIDETNCFYNCTGLTDYYSIPSSWR